MCSAGPYGIFGTGMKALPCCMHRYLRDGELGGKPNRFNNEKTTVGRLPEDSVMCKGIIKDKQIFNTMNKLRKNTGEIHNVYGK